MEKYDYEESVRNAVKEFIKGNLTDEQIENMGVLRLAEYITDICWNEDDVTGNASGSYTLSRAKAEIFLMGNWDLVREAFEEIGYEYIPLEAFEPEYLDVVVRCYMLSNLSYSIAKEIQEERMNENESKEII